MFSRKVHAVLTVIALSVFADKRVLSTEITAFVKSADVIQKKVQSDIPVTEAKLLLWFELNRMEIRDKMSLGPVGFKRWFETLMTELVSISDKTFISDLVRLISHADGELHVSERALAVMLENKFKSSYSTD